MRTRVPPRAPVRCNEKPRKDATSPRLIGSGPNASSLPAIRNPETERISAAASGGRARQRASAWCRNCSPACLLAESAAGLQRDFSCWLNYRQSLRALASTSANAHLEHRASPLLTARFNREWNLCDTKPANLRSPRQSAYFVAPGELLSGTIGVGRDACGRPATASLIPRILRQAFKDSSPCRIA